jgi:hypothetical protein
MPRVSHNLKAHVKQSWNDSRLALRSWLTHGTWETRSYGFVKDLATWVLHNFLPSIMGQMTLAQSSRAASSARVALPLLRHQEGGRERVHPQSFNLSRLKSFKA